MSKSGRAATANLKQTAQEAQTRLQEAGQGLLQAPEVNCFCVPTSLEHPECW